MYLYISGQCEYEVLHWMYNNQIGIKGLKNNESILRVLKKYIPTAAILGGLCIAIVSMFSDMIGSIVPGTSMFMVSGIVFGVYDSLKSRE